jgi:dihydrodipicolinate synthase/N-acetylneuraminate lyase
MAYTQEPARFADQIASARDLAGTHPVWAGIGAYRLSPAQTVENIQAARRLGAAGFVLFSYDSLTGPKPPAPNYLAAVSRAAFSSSSDDQEPPRFTPVLDERR